MLESSDSCAADVVAIASWPRPVIINTPDDLSADTRREEGGKKGWKGKKTPQNSETGFVLNHRRALLTTCAFYSGKWRLWFPAKTCDNRLPTTSSLDDHSRNGEVRRIMQRAPRDFSSFSNNRRTTTLNAHTFDSKNYQLDANEIILGKYSMPIKVSCQFVPI